MSASHPFTLVIAVDLSEYASTVLQHGFDQALRHDAPVVHVATVIPEGRPDEVTRKDLIELVRETLDDVVPEDRRDDWTVVAHVRHGLPEEEIVELGEEALASMIVVGRFGAAHRRHHASTADPIVAGAGCPVLVVPPPRDTTASDAQCEECVALRARSRGEQWFCDAHHTERLGHSLSVIGSASGPGTSLW
jgi:nucleotide-binding universal stress UspA family protein